MKILQKTNNGKKTSMRKSIFAIAMLVLLTSSSAMAQIFLDDESLFVGSRLNSMDEQGNYVPLLSVDRDEERDLYVPMGSSILLLSTLGGAYLLSKSRKND